MEDDGKSYKIINGAYACTKTLIFHLFLLKKVKTIWGMKSARRDLSNTTNQSFVALAVWKLELTEISVFAKKYQEHLLICPPSPKC